MVYYELNNELNGIELYFEEGEEPTIKITLQMKNIGLNYNNQKKCWYTQQSNKTGVKFIKDYCRGRIKPTTISFESMLKKRYCYADSIANFNKLDVKEFNATIRNNFNDGVALELSQGQIDAWEDSFYVMKNLSLNPKINIIFEYILPYEGGRRPDIILLSKEQVIVLEFKMKNRIKEEDLDQASAYARDLEEYHYQTRDKKVTPILVLTRTKNLNKKINGIICVSDDLLQSTLDNIYEENINSEPLDKWINSKYEPLPTIVDAARIIMENEELPNIRRVNSTCIPETLENLNTLTDYAKNNKKHVISFVTGVPGAGKTYLGLKYVYNIKEFNSVYLSGNGPLVKVLTDTLKSDVFVKDLHKIEREFLYYRTYLNNNVIVFDEGQRAWNNERMQEADRGDRSEPELMIELCEKGLEWCVLLILVGEGQEIHKGENSGLKLWDVAINNGEKEWEIVYPPKLSEIFKKESLKENINDEVFDLTISLRSHLSGDVSDFVNYLIEGNIEEASKLSGKIIRQKYEMYCTRNLTKAKKYCKGRYIREPNKRYGLITSSKARGLKKYGFDGSYEATKDLDYGKWYNAPPYDQYSCCKLNQAVSEFGVQGLELDMPIIGWGTDMKWNGERWEKFDDREDENSAKNLYRRNSYRVLLTRGRDGFIVFVPNDKRLDPVYDILKEVGIKELTDEESI